MSIGYALRRWQCTLQMSRNVVRLAAFFIERELTQITFNCLEWVETSMKISIVQKTDVVYQYELGTDKTYRSTLGRDYRKRYSWTPPCLNQLLSKSLSEHTINEPIAYSAYMFLINRRCSSLED